MKWFKRRNVGLALIVMFAMALFGGTALALPTPSWGHYTYEEGSSGSWYKPVGCPQAIVRFYNTSNPDDGTVFGLQQVAPGYPYPQMYTYQNVAYFVVTNVKSDYCSGSISAVYTVRTDPGMGNPSTAGWDMGGPGISNPSCTMINDGSGKGYNCTFDIAAGSYGQIRTKHYVGFGSTTKSTYVYRTLRTADWSAIYNWDTWSYSQVSGP